MSGRLVALDKLPGVITVGIGELFRSLLAKLILCTGGARAKESCGSAIPCEGLEAGIEVAIHVVGERAELGRVEMGEDWRRRL